MRNYITINYNKQTIEHHYLTEIRDECGNTDLEWNEQTIAHISHHCAKIAYERLNEMYERCTAEELTAIAAYAKQLANDKIKALKKYL